MMPAKEDGDVDRCGKPVPGSRRGERTQFNQRGAEGVESAVSPPSWCCDVDRQLIMTAAAAAAAVFRTES